ncbi:MAG: hypothetical protein HY706_09285 [Candidatus Hydrogenedentes bacterium]|nr:hypothetical protein [Candidatus Hydrogenedentota bacterium]
MKRLLTILALLTLPVLAADSPHGGVLGVPGGRFVFGSVADGSILSTFMLDTQTGRLWKYSVDKEKGLHLAPIVYTLADGTISLLPTDTKQELELLERKRALEAQTKEKGKTDGK